MNELKDLQDRKIICVECGKAFTWYRDEQAFFISKGLTSPKRCKPCRERRKLTIAPGTVQDE
ncbi:zinc-ribbon domain containing protein [Chloroflexota bacterium]